MDGTKECAFHPPLVKNVFYPLSGISCFFLVYTCLLALCVLCVYLPTNIFGYVCVQSLIFNCQRSYRDFHRKCSGQTPLPLFGEMKAFALARRKQSAIRSDGRASILKAQVESRKTRPRCPHLYPQGFHKRKRPDTCASRPRLAAFISLFVSYIKNFDAFGRSFLLESARHVPTQAENNLSLSTWILQEHRCIEVSMRTNLLTNAGTFKRLFGLSPQDQGFALYRRRPPRYDVGQLGPIKLVSPAL